MITIRMSKVFVELLDEIASKMGISRSELIKGILITIAVAYLTKTKMVIELAKVPFGRGLRENGRWRF